MMNTTEMSFENDVLKKRGLVLVDFWAPWCGPCRMVAPVLEELEKDHGAEVAIRKVNVDNEGRLAQQFRVSSIPTLILFKDGKPVDGVIGVRPKEYFEELLRKHK